MQVLNGHGLQLALAVWKILKIWVPRYSIYLCNTCPFLGPADHLIDVQQYAYAQGHQHHLGHPFSSIALGA